MTVLTIDSDLIAFFKLAVWVASIFLAAYALIGVVFFGWDVAKARGSLKEAEKEVREQMKELRTDFKQLKDLKERLEELGAQLEEQAEAVEQQKPPKQLPDGPGGSKSPEPPTSSPPSHAPTDAQFARAESRRSNLELVREVLASSKFEWTTFTRLVNRTGLSREEVLSIARSTPDIVIGFGKQTKDHLFKRKADPARGESADASSES